MSTAERAHPDAVMLDESLLRDIRDQLVAAGVTACVAFVLVEMCEAGMRATAVDIATGAGLTDRSDNKLSTKALDLAVADHLVRTGRVERPESVEWAGELIELVTDIRGRLATGDGAFAMGTDHIGLLRVSRRELTAALHPHLMAAQSLWQATALHADLPVGAIVFMPEHSRWPGLFATMAQLAPIPALALPDPTTPLRASGRHLSSDAPPEIPDVPEVPVAAPTPAPRGLHIVPSEPSPSSGEPIPAPAVHRPQAVAPDAAGPPEPIADPISTPVPVPAVIPVATEPLLVSAPPAPPHVETGSSVESTHVMPRRHRGGTFLPDPPGKPRFAPTREQDMYFPTADERAPISVHDHREVKRSAGPRHYSPPVAEGSVSTEARRTNNKRLLMGATVVATSAVVGIVVLTLPWIDDGDTGTLSRAQAAPPTSAPQRSTAAPAPEPSRTPIDTGPARVPVAQYVAPPPPTATSAPARPAPRRAAPARPRQRSIPNPIPGLPPILLP